MTLRLQTWMTRFTKGAVLALPLILTACPGDLATPIQRDMSQSSLVSDDDFDMDGEATFERTSETERVPFKVPAPEGGGSNKGARLQLSPDGKTLHVERAGKIETVDIGSASTVKEEISPPKSEQPEVRSEDGKVEARAEANKVIVESPDLNKGKPVKVKMHENNVTQLAIASDASVVVSGSSDGSVCVLKIDGKSKKPVCALPAGRKSVNALTLADKAGQAFVAFQGGTVGRLSIDSSEETLKSSLKDEREVLSLASDGEGKTLFVLDEELEVSGFRVLDEPNTDGSWLEPLMIERQVTREAEAGAPAGPKRPKETDYCRCESRGPDGSCINPSTAVTFRESKDSDGAVRWFGGGCVARPLSDVWALTRQFDKIKSSDVNNPVTVSPQAGTLDPKFSHAFMVDYKVSAFIDVDWRMEWFHSPRPLGERNNPMVVVINYQKTAGTGWIKKIEGSWALKAIAPNVTAFAVEEVINAAQTDGAKVRGEFERLLGILGGKQ